MVVIMKSFECLFYYFHHIKKLLLMDIETELVVWKLDVGLVIIKVMLRCKNEVNSGKFSNLNE